MKDRHKLTAELLAWIVSDSVLCIVQLVGRERFPNYEMHVLDELQQFQVVAVLVGVGSGHQGLN